MGKGGKGNRDEPPIKISGYATAHCTLYNHSYYTTTNKLVINSMYKYDQTVCGPIRKKKILRSDMNIGYLVK